MATTPDNEASSENTPSPEVESAEQNSAESGGDSTAAAEPIGPEASSALRAFFGLFLVPLVVVVLCVAVFVGFGWIAYERNTTRDYLNDLRSGWRPRRAQAAYELSKILVADPDALVQEPGAIEELRKMFRQAEDPEIRRYLALVLGYTGDAGALPELTAALDTADPETRIYLLWALGSVGDSAALPALTEALAESDPGVRKTAAFALGVVGDPSVVPRLEVMLEDPVADVRWNAALAVTRLGSAAGAPVLERMLDRRLTSAVPGITAEQQRETMVAAIGALAAVRGDEALPVLDRLAEEDPDLKVRQAAIEARRTLAGGA